MDLVEGILGYGEHAHVWPELLNQLLDDVLACCVACHANTLGRHLLPRVLEVEPHHPVELQLLQHQPQRFISMLTLTGFEARLNKNKKLYQLQITHAVEPSY